MINDILQPKSHSDVIKGLKDIKVPSYRLSSFFILIQSDEAGKLRNWCTTVFKMDPKNMEVTQFSSGFVKSCLDKALGSQGRGFASNANWKLMRSKNDYYIYPKGSLGKIVIQNFVDNNRMGSYIK